jgi:hypothetical protein
MATKLLHVCRSHSTATARSSPSRDESGIGHRRDAPPGSCRRGGSAGIVGSGRPRQGRPS